MEPTIDKAIELVASDSFEPADFGPYSFMSYGGGSFVVDESLAPADAVAAAKAKEQEILDGLFRVNVNDTEPKSTM
jgi:hypothetical protein